MRLRSWAKENQPIFAVIGSLLVIGGFLWAVVRLVFAPPQLAITLQTSDLSLPWSLYARLERVRTRDIAGFSDSARTAIAEVAGFLRDTRSFAQLTLTNTSSESLGNVDVRFQYVHDLVGWAVESDVLDIEERKRLRDAVKYDAANGLVTLRGITRLPPKSSLKLFVWGNVSYAALLGNEQVKVTYDGGEGRVVTERTIRGVDAFIYDNSALLVLVTVLVNVGIWNATLHKRRPKRS
jgi:hypothetical protein